MSQTSISVVKFENQKLPEFKEVTGKDWIMWGDENEYPDYLIELFMRSATNNAIITGKVNYIVGNGWQAVEQGSTVENKAIVNNFIASINKNESLNEFTEKITPDFEIFNGFAFEVIYNKKGDKFELYHIPFNKLRTNKDESKYYYSNDWSNKNQSEEKTGLKEFEPFAFKPSSKSTIFVYRILSPRVGKSPNVYPFPEYIGSTQAIETDAECSNYNLSEIKSGFSAGTILNFYNGEPSPDEKKEIEKKIKQKFSGTDRAGSIIINYADGKERGSEVVSLSGNDLDKRYADLKKDVRQEIFTGHKVSSPMLFGVKTEGQLGGRAEVQESFELFQNTYISRRQRIIENVINKFAALAGIVNKLEIRKVTAIGYAIPDSLIEKAMPIEYVQNKLGIKPSKNITGNSTTTVNMASEKEDSIFVQFNKIGIEKESVEILESIELHDANYFSVDKSEKLYFANKITSRQASIIDLINKDNKIPSSELAKALNCSTSDIELDLTDLSEQGYLDASKTGYIPTQSGIDILKNVAAKTANVELLYSYELRSNAPKLIKGGESREFCKRLMRLNKLYTRKEIDALSNGMGLDVWTYKGGWYTNPNTDAPTPQCRHIWVQHVTKKK